jgi:type I restriction enzyme S subunit
MIYKKVKLSEICTIEKGATGITKAIEGEYPMVTMAEARTSHNEYQFDTKAVLIPLVSSTGHGHASMKRIHYQEGKFAVGSILCALVPKNEDVVNARFLYNYLHFQRESILVPLMRGAANVSLSIKSISSVEIDLPPIETQISINKLVDDFKLRQDIFQTELKTQSNLLSKLRQAYLQEAVMGKLTEPSQDNAQTVLKAIKSQKAELIKQGKLRKEKPLAPIKPEEIPFEIPDNWAWCRLGEIIKISSGSGLTSHQMVKEGVIPVFGGNGITGYHDKSNVDEETVVIGRVGYYCGCVHLTPNNAWVTDNAFITTFPKDYINRDFLILLLKTAELGKQQFAGSQPVISGQRVYPKLVPIPPPLSEQKAIVAKVEGLLGNVSLLESENKAQQIDVQRLMGAVLQEAFGGK